MWETLKIKTENYCNMREARRRYQELHPLPSTKIATFAATMSQSSQKNHSTSNNSKPNSITEMTIRNLTITTKYTI